MERLLVGATQDEWIEVQAALNARIDLMASRASEPMRSAEFVRLCHEVVEIVTEVRDRITRELAKVRPVTGKTP